MDPKNVTRYIRPKDVPAVDSAIIDPIIQATAKDMAEAHPDLSEEAWARSLRESLLRGDILIVIDDVNKRLGLVPSDRPPFLGLDDDSIGRPQHADPLNLKRWEMKTRQSNITAPQQPE